MSHSHTKQQTYRTRIQNSKRFRVHQHLNKASDGLKKASDGLKKGVKKVPLIYNIYYIFNTKPPLTNRITPPSQYDTNAQWQHHKLRKFSRVYPHSIDVANACLKRCNAHL